MSIQYYLMHNNFQTLNNCYLWFPTLKCNISSSRITLNYISQLRRWYQSDMRLLLINYFTVLMFGSCTNKCIHFPWDEFTGHMYKRYFTCGYQMKCGILYCDKIIRMKLFHITFKTYIDYIISVCIIIIL